MTREEFVAEMRKVTSSLKGKFSKEHARKMGHQLFLDYLKDKEEIERDLVEEFGQFSYFGVQNTVDVLMEERRKIFKELDKIIKEIEREMVFVALGGPELLMPLEIHKSSMNQQEETSTPVSEDDEKYQLAKTVFFGTSLSYNSIKQAYYVTSKVWDKMCGNEILSEFIIRLKAEGKAYFEEVGYYEAQRKKVAARRFFEEQMASMTSEEKNTLRFLIKDGKKIKIV